MPSNRRRHRLPFLFGLLLLLVSGAGWEARAQQGACCIEGACVQTLEGSCAPFGGTFLGEGIPCDPNPCLPICALEPSVVDYGRITVNTTRERDFVLRNAGYVRAQGSFGESCEGFQFVSGGSYDLAPGETKSFTVRFVPTAIGSYQCQVDGTGCEGPLLLGEASSSGPACLLSTTNLDFGAIGVGQFRDRTLTVRNAGDGLLVGRAVGCGPFTVISGESWELGAGEEQAIVVRFRPRAEGSFSCTIETGAECPNLSVSGRGEPTPVCLVAPADLQFGEVVLDTPVDRSFTIENTGSGTLTGTVRLSCPDFVLVGAVGYSLSGGETQVFTVRFVPRLEGEAECEIDLGLACGDLLAQGAGVRAPICAFAPTFLDFGTVPLGSSRVDTFRVTNFGGSELAGTFTLDCPAFEILGDPSYLIAPGEHRTFDVRFTPRVLGGVICRIAGEGCSEYTLRGFGVEGPECRVEPTAIDLGTVAEGLVHRTSVLLANDGGAVLAGTAALVPVDSTASAYRFAATGESALSYSLSAGQELEIIVELVADRLGPAVATIDLGASGANCPPVSVRAEVEDPPECMLSMESWDFGSIFLGDSAETTLSLTNAGGTRLVGTVALDCPAFSIASEARSYDLGSGESLELTLRFAPETEGEAWCAVDFGALCAPVVLTGRGERPPTCQIDAPALDFGVVELGEFADRSFFVENVGGGRLVGQALSSCPSFFFVGGHTWELEAGQSREIVVRFVPDRSGPSSCLLNLGPDCPPLGVAGTGNGPICVVSPSVLRFGTVLPGSNRDLTLVVSNAGGGTLRGAVNESCDGFSVLGENTYELRGGESRQITVRFAPRLFGAASCEFDLSGGCGGILATGSGGAPPLCSLDVETLDFGEIALGSVVRRSFRIENLGEGRLRGQVGANCAGFRVLGTRSFDLGSHQSQAFEIEFTAYEEGLLICEIDLGADCRQLDAVADVRLPVGACCFADGSCATTGEEPCARSGGLDWLEGASCAEARCLPLGACCASDGSCTLTTSEECFADSGVAWAEGGSCTTEECPPAGACCLLDGTCRIVVEDGCAGDYLGDDTVCSPSPCLRRGACCFPDGTCLVTTEDGCTPVGGASWSLGIRCQDVTCEPAGACCLPSETCIVTTEVGCQGDYLGDASTCMPEICVVAGACCGDDGECAVTRRDLCAGTFLGAEVPCAPGICDPKVEDVRVVRTETGAEIEVVTPAGFVSELEGWYRAAGTFVYTQIPEFEWRNESWISRFDESASTVRGVEYYLSYFDEALGVRVLHGSPNLPYRLGIEGSDIVPFPPAGEFAMLAAPFRVDAAATLYDVLAEHLGMTGSRSWKMGTWNPQSESYVLIDPQRPNGLESGSAYWFVASTRPDPLALSGTTQFPPERSYTFPLRIQPGWNMIGNPAAYPIRTSPDRAFVADRGEVLTLGDASSGDAPRVSPLYAYVPGSPGPFAPYEVAPPHLTPWQGAWIENRTGHVLTLLLPAVDAFGDDAVLEPPVDELVRLVSMAPSPSRGRATEVWADDGGATALTIVQSIEVRSGGELRRLMLGTVPGANDGLDGWDLADPPPAPGSTLSAAFHLPLEETPRRLLRDVRTEGDGAIWWLDLRSDSPIEVRFGAAPHGQLTARIRDDEPWRPLSSMRSWIVPAGTHRMVLRLLGPGEPTEDGEAGAGGWFLRLEPHPIRGASNIVLEQGTAGSARLELYDVRGARIFEQSIGPLDAGTHVVRWDGRRSDGGPIEAGTYFLRLLAPGGRCTRKVIVLP